MQGLYEAILERMDEGVCAVDAEGRIAVWNAAAERITGYRAEDVLGRAGLGAMLPHPALSAGTFIEQSGQVYLHHKHGHRVPVNLRSAPLYDDDGAEAGYLQFMTAVPTGRPVPGGAALTEGDRDPLTELANRRGLRRHIEPLVAQDEEPKGVLFIDVDGFKAINDQYGHAVGDRVLRMVARTLANGLRQSDWAVRWGGEEFVAIVHAARAEALAEVAERLRALVASCWAQVGDDRIGVTVSIGATMMDSGEVLETAIDRADHLMYESKHAGRNRVTCGRPGIVVDLTTG